MFDFLPFLGSNKYMLYLPGFEYNSLGTIAEHCCESAIAVANLVSPHTITVDFVKFSPPIHIAEDPFGCILKTWPALILLMFHAFITNGPEEGSCLHATKTNSAAIQIGKILAFLVFI
jgi:hypothetical protein